MATEAAILRLEKGNKLCSSRKLEPNKVSKIYSECKAILKDDTRKDTPLILASRQGLAHMVWGFIECAKLQAPEYYNYKDFDTDFRGGLQSLLDQKNWCDNTALHVAAANSFADDTNNDDDVVKILLSNVSLEQLISCRNSNRQTPLSLLTNYKYDEQIFECLERTRNAEKDAVRSTIISVDDEQEGPKKYPCKKKSKAALAKYDSEKELHKLDKGILEITKDGTILHRAAMVGDVDLTKAIMEKHSYLMNDMGKIEGTKGTEGTKGIGMIPAIAAASEGQLEIEGSEGTEGTKGSEGTEGTKGSEGTKGIDMIPAIAAASEGQLDILRMMIDYFKRKNDDLEEKMKTSDNNSALHLAIQKHHVGVVFWLIKEVPTLVNHINEDIKSPLYVAAEEGHAAIVKLILESCKEVPSVCGPKDATCVCGPKNATCVCGPKGATALHAAARKGSVDCIKHLLCELKMEDEDKHEEVPSVCGPKGATALHAAARKGSVDCIKHLLCSNSNPCLLEKEDEDKQWVPLDEAVFGGHLSATKELLDQSVNLGYRKKESSDNYLSPIHTAAKFDYREILEYLISKCPGCVDITTDETRWNILHIAIKYSSIKVIAFIFQQKSLSGLINQKDNDGNTPIHLLLDKAFNTEKEEEKEKFCSLDIMKILKDRKVDCNAINNKSQKPIDMVASPAERVRLWEAISQKPPKWQTNKAYDSGEARKQFDMIDQIVIVVALTLTTSFAAAFAVPGGYDGNHGMPILLQKFAYKVFIVANALAFICSGSVLIQHVRMLIGRYSKNGIYQDDLDRIVHRAFSMYGLTGMAMVAMVIAFISGTYVTLTPSLCFGISVCSICISIFVGILLLDVKLGALVHKFWNICVAITGG